MTVEEKTCGKSSQEVPRRSKLAGARRSQHMFMWGTPNDGGDSHQILNEKQHHNE